MKQKIFTLVLMLAMVFVASSAWALNETRVYRGGTYYYKLNDIVVANLGTATIVYSGDASATITATGGFTGSAPTFTAPAASYDATFSILFSATATVGVGTLTVTIFDGSPSNCSNFITYQIEVLELPVYTLSIAPATSSLQDCQVRGGSGNNTANALGTDVVDEQNTFDFVVTSTIENIPSGDEFSYTYTITLPTEAGNDLNSFVVTPASTISITGGVVSGTGTGITNGDDIVRTDLFTVTFNTTTGVDAQGIMAQLTTTAGAAILTPTTVGGRTINAGFGNTSSTVTINAVPAIGSFGD